MWLFDSAIGQLLLALLERCFGLAVVPVEQLAQQAADYLVKQPQ